LPEMRRGVYGSGGELMATLEQDFLEELLKALGSRDSIKLHRQNVGQVLAHRGGRPIGIFKAGPPKGASDLSGIVSPEGWRIELELKSAKAVTTEPQVNWGIMIKRFGGVHAQIRFNEALTMQENVELGVQTVDAAIAERRARK
jgi:hypothetical protein